jgi:serine/threonine protein kinase
MTDQPIAPDTDSAEPTRTRTPQPNADAPAEGLGTVDDRYVLENAIGGGGMGVVYRARDLLMEKHHDRNSHIALKLISQSLRTDVHARTLLQRECSRAQRLSHQNIVHVFYFGCDKATDSDYLTMELLQGDSLERLIRKCPSGYDWKFVADIVEQLCDGLAYAHKAQIVHSDIKPSNVFMTVGHVLKILDFGIAAPMRDGDASSTETYLNPRRLGALSPRYSSLEMHMGLDASPSDDVYSAACVIYELLTGQHPFGELPTPNAAEQNLVPRTIASLSDSQNAVLRKALSFRRSERIATALELKQGLLVQTAAAPESMRSMPADTPAVPGRKITIRVVIRGLALTALLALTLFALRPYVAARLHSMKPSTPARAAETATPKLAAPSALEQTAPAPASAGIKFENRCGLPPSAPSLDTLVGQGLKAQTALAFEVRPEPRKAASAAVRKTAECIRALAALGLESPQSRAWLADANASLATAP